MGRIRMKLTKPQSDNLMNNTLSSLWFNDKQITHIDRLENGTIKLLSEDDHVGYGFEVKRELSISPTDGIKLTKENKSDTLFNIVNNWLKPFIREMRLEEIGI